MILQYSPFFLPLLASAAVTLVLAGFALKVRSNRSQNRLPCSW